MEAGAGSEGSVDLEVREVRGVQARSARAAACTSRVGRAFSSITASSTIWDKVAREVREVGADLLVTVVMVAMVDRVVREQLAVSGIMAH